MMTFQILMLVIGGSKRAVTYVFRYSMYFCSTSAAGRKQETTHKLRLMLPSFSLQENIDLSREKPELWLDSHFRLCAGGPSAWA